MCTVISNKSGEGRQGLKTEKFLNKWAKKKFTFLICDYYYTTAITIFDHLGTTVYEFQGINNVYDGWLQTERRDEDPKKGLNQELTMY